MNLSKVNEDFELLKHDVNEYIKTLRNEYFKDGSICPFCSKKAGVIDSRYHSNKGIVRRRRCGTCGHRWNTVEIVDFKE